MVDQYNPAVYNQDVVLEIPEGDLVDSDIHERSSDIFVLKKIKWS